MLDTHKLVMDNTTKFLNDSHSVFSATHEVDYDQEGKTNSSSVFAHVSLPPAPLSVYDYRLFVPPCRFEFSHRAFCVSDAPTVVVE